ncbi:hypothetical protein PIB30_042177 [Stylosanthes scabra]|uniref:Uncharacterized protein n=1 Tax=Stylosanthes scabra TaxID=79078 RepID=A0ABU6SFG9_9FABA|nr:hypothetical protein [Stylosanthes scabra]
MAPQHLTFSFSAAIPASQLFFLESPSSLPMTTPPNSPSTVLRSPSLTFITIHGVAGVLDYFLYDNDMFLPPPLPVVSSSPPNDIIMSSFLAIGETMGGMSGGYKEHRGGAGAVNRPGQQRTAIAAAASAGSLQSVLAPTFNLAVALASNCQLKVGWLDADVYGPNIYEQYSLTSMHI